MNTNTQTQLFALYQRHQSLYQAQHQHLPLVAYDPEWVSECQVGEPVGDNMHWQAVKRDEKANLRNIEEALDITLHPCIEDFFCSAYCEHIACDFEGHPVELVQVCNEQDFVMLQENMIAHFMMQKRLKKPASMFIASCSDEMQIISVLNETGQVQLETLGKKQEAILAESLAEFLEKLTPIV